MNSVELKEKLVQMAQEHGKHEKSVYDGIIEVVMTRYFIFSGYYEEDAIATFSRFLEKGILSF